MTASPVDTTTDLHAVIAALRTERDAALSEKAALAEALATRDSEYGERIEQQSATIDVLQAMSASPGDPQPVFDLIVHHANELCDGSGVGLFEFDGNLVHLRANVFGDAGEAEIAGYRAMFPMVPSRGSISCRAILDKQIIHIKDYQNDREVHPTVRAMGYQSQLSIPLMREGTAVGVISLGGPLGGFTDSQVALLQTFAEQAVIAITSAEMYRALQGRTSDLQEALEQQTATAEVLNVISRSTFDLTPVLNKVAETATRLCVADQAAIYLVQGDRVRLATNFGFPPEYEAAIANWGEFPGFPNPVTVGYRTLAERQTVHILDVTAVPGYSEVPVKLGKQRTSLGIPLLRNSEAIGLILLARQRVEPFTDRQIELVSTFADQAVIAIENTRLLTEQREALEQQTATAEVLQVINSSPGDLTPVFEAMLEKAIRLCRGDRGVLWTIDGGRGRIAAARGLPVEFVALLRERGESGTNSPLQRVVQGEWLIEFRDTVDEFSRSGDPHAKGAVEAGVRSAIWVAIVKEGVAVGAFAIGRPVIGTFSDKQIALLQNFAAQAVIAMDNARLITEQREALEQQTATAEVLQVINSSPGDLKPVFETLLDRAMRLCGANFGEFQLFDGERLRLAAFNGVPGALAEFRRNSATLPTRGPTTLRMRDGANVIHTADLMAEDAYREGNPHRRALVDLGGARTVLAVALRKDDKLLGAINIYRQEVKPFSDRQIALLQSFAAQAIIAMENARLLTETREALEQQTATAEVLQVINANPGNLTPVFDTILEKAHSRCNVAVGSLSVYVDGLVYTAATRGFSEEYQALLRHPYPAIGSHQALMRGGPSRQTPDFRTVPVSPEMASSFEHLERMNLRAGLWVPLSKDGAALGCISLYRDKVQPFSEKEIALLENFAAQAVIAMENARLLEEVRQREEELRVTFENWGDGVAMFDETHHLVAWNRKFQDILDVPDDIVARRRTFSEYVRYLADRGEFGAGPEVEERVRQLIEQAGQYRAYERTRPDGRVIEIRHNPVTDGGFVLIYSDITERKRSEAEIRAARDAAEEASRTIEAAYRDLKTAQANLIQAEKMASLGQLTAGIAHEIKNPLNFVNNFAALSVDLLSELKETAAPGFAELTEKQRAEVEDVSAMLTSNLEKITEHGKRADDIVKAMLEHSRGSSGERRKVDINTLTDEALNLAYHGARAQDQTFNITLERDFSAGIAPIEVNPQDITRVFLNLFSNGFYAATRRAREGGDTGFVPTLALSTRDGGDAVVIRVRDNGTGIPAEIRDKLFQPFFTTKPTGEGTGLGLSITYDIVTQQHGGSIAVDSKVGDYSEFTIRLPRYRL